MTEERPVPFAGLSRGESLVVELHYDFVRG